MTPPASLRPSAPRLVALATLLVGTLLLLLGGRDVAPATAAPVRCETAPLGAATGWTEFVAGDGRRGSESEGAIAYGGSLQASGMTVGTRLASSAATPTLVVAGTGNSFNLQRGSAYVGTLTGRINFNGGGSRLASSPLDIPAAFVALRDASARWGALPSTGTASVVNSDSTVTPMGGNVLLLTGTNSDLNVFTVTRAQLTGIRATFIDTPAGSTTLINVLGADPVTVNGEVRYRSGNSFVQSNDGTTQRNATTLWNLPAATGMTLNTNAAYGGSILAPRAQVVAQSIGHNLGQVIAQGFSSNYETHQHLFTGCLPTAEVPATPAELLTTKGVDRTTAVPGEVATFALGATNRGGTAAADVVLTDVVPAGLTIGTLPAGCARDGRTVRCVAGTLVPGDGATFRIPVTVEAPSSPIGGGDDRITPYKVQSDWTLDGGASTTARLACNAGDLLGDGSVRIVDIDPQYGDDRGAIEVRRATATAPGTFEAVLVNHGRGRAQGRLHLACLPAATDGGRALRTAAPVVTTATLPAGTHELPLACGTDRIAIRPGIDVVRGSARIVGSRATDDGATRRLIVEVGPDDADLTVSAGCLERQTATDRGAVRLGWTTISRTVVVPAGATVDEQLICGEQQKGIVAGWTLAPGVVQAGHEPQIKSRVFTLSNAGTAPQPVELQLLCLDDRTGPPTAIGGGSAQLVNTVNATSTTPQGPGAVLSATATVTRTSGAATRSAVRTVTLRSTNVNVVLRCTKGCSGVATVRTAGRLRTSGRTYRAKVRVGAKRFVTRPARTTTVSVRVPARVRAALRRTRGAQVEIVLRDARGRRAYRTVGLRKR
jgi:choice-of-anchor A domain-containing protein/uncharacterized repeat protein (TIGR01451 family)